MVTFKEIDSGDSPSDVATNASQPKGRKHVRKSPKREKKKRKKDKRKKEKKKKREKARKKVKKIRIGCDRSSISEDADGDSHTMKCKLESGESKLLKPEPITTEREAATDFDVIRANCATGNPAFKGSVLAAVLNDDDDDDSEYL